MAAIWRMKRSACRRGGLSAPPKMVSTCRRNLRCSFTNGASSTTEARSRRSVKVSMALSVIWPAHIQQTIIMIMIMIAFLSQEASGTCDASQLHPDRLVLSITGVVV